MDVTIIGLFAARAFHMHEFEASGSVSFPQNKHLDIQHLAIGKPNLGGVIAWHGKPTHLFEANGLGVKSHSLVDIAHDATQVDGVR